MIKFSVILILISLLGCASPSPQPDCNFLKNQFNERVSWKDQAPVTYYLHSSVPVEFRTSVEYAANKWNSAAQRTLITISPFVVPGPINATRDGKNVIYFYTSNWSSKSTVQGEAKVNYFGDMFLDTDIILNGVNYKYYTLGNSVPDAVNIETLLIHEMGHTLGLMHSKDQDSVMFGFLAKNMERTEIESSTVDSLKCEY